MRNRVRSRCKLEGREQGREVRNGIGGGRGGGQEKGYGLDVVLVKHINIERKERENYYVCAHPHLQSNLLWFPKIAITIHLSSVQLT